MPPPAISAPPRPPPHLYSSACFAKYHILLLLALFASYCHAFIPKAQYTPAPPPSQIQNASISPYAAETNQTIPSISPYAAETNQTIPSCAFSAFCGEINISYPFWLSHADPANKSSAAYCGYQGLELFCQNNKTILRLQSDNYTVISIDYATRTLSLADSDVLGKQCPRVRHNLTFYDQSSLVYDHVYDANLTFFFNCTVGAQLRAQISSHEIDCLSSGAKPSFVFNDSVVAPHPLEFYGLTSPDVCADVVVAPVLRKTLPRNVSTIPLSFGQSLHQGFQLTWWQSGDCAKCESSRGRCGLNQTTNTSFVFTCFCPDGITRFPDCKKAKGLSREKKLIIGFAAAVGIIILGLLAFFLFHKYKKKQKYSASSKSLMRDVSFGTNINKESEISSVNFQTRVFAYKELQEATNFFDASRELGDGGFGTVYKGELKDGRIVAVKRLYENSYRRLEQFMNEVEILSQLHHPNLVNLYGCTSHHSRELLLVYEFVSNGTIADHLHGSRASEALLTWPMRLNIAIETADALRYLHAVEPPIIHRDIKSNNILLDSSFHVKVGDFGLSRLFPDNVTHVSTAPQGTPGYLDPEYHQCYQLTVKSDVYSFGVVLVELITSKPAVDITRHRSEINLANLAINRIQNGEIDQLADPNLGYHSNRAVRKMITMAAELAFRCLQTDGDMRPPIKEVVEVLRTIEIEGYNMEKEEDDARTQDDTGLLKNVPPLSPDSVMHDWVSRSTTPNPSV